MDQLGLAAGALGTSPAEILRQVDQALLALKNHGVVVQHGNAKEIAQQGLALIGAVALGVLIVKALGGK